MRMRIGLMIKQYLLEKGEGNPYEFWRKYSPHTSYQHVAKYFYMLKRLGLIEKIREEPSSRSSTIPKSIYRIVPGMEEDPCWEYPQSCLYEDLRERIREWKRARLERILERS